MTFTAIINRFVRLANYKKNSLIQVFCPFTSMKQGAVACSAISVPCFCTIVSR